MEADMACGLLRTEGIRCGHRQTTYGGAIAESVSGFGPREVYVDPSDADRAQELLKEGT
jgi:hypothetical protein